MNRYSNKKGFTEITSFALITFLIIVSSIMAYLFSTEMLEDNIIQLDSKNMKNNFKSINYKLLEITNFDGSSFSVNVNFNKGLFIFENNSLKYLSLLKYTGNEFCENRICYNSSGGYENIYFFLPTGYVFSENISLNPDKYNLRFKNNKNEKKIYLYIE